MTNVLQLNAHPYPESFVDGLAEAYREGAEEAGHELRYFDLRELDFDPVLHGGYRDPTPLEPDLEEQQELLEWCDHLTICTPVWWMGTPPLLKGWFDRVLLPGFAFKYHENDPLWDGLLAGRSARVIYTQDSPQWFAWLFRGDCFWKQINHGTLGFCGFKPVRRMICSQVKYSDRTRRERWKEEARELGRRAS